MPKNDKIICKTIKWYTSKIIWNSRLNKKNTNKQNNNIGMKTNKNIKIFWIKNTSNEKYKINIKKYKMFQKNKNKMRIISIFQIIHNSFFKRKYSCVIFKISPLIVAISQMSWIEESIYLRAVFMQNGSSIPKGRKAKLDECFSNEFASSIDSLFTIL